jgi:beta-fructofuranosidase
MQLKRLFSYVILFSCILFAEVAAQTQPPLNESYASKVPKFTFSETLAEQESELQSNGLVNRFAAARKKQQSDRYRPLYHFVSPEGAMNDPNGLSYWRGNWHLFYQGFPPEDKRPHWGHAVSSDLIHWRDLPYAIYPDPEWAVYSGTVLVEKSRAIAMYHGPRAGNMVAVSTDPLLLNWEKITGAPVIPIKSTNGFPTPYSVFDPSIWVRDGVYYSLSAGRIPQAPSRKKFPTAFLFRSKDLVNWEYLHEFVEGDRFTLAGDDIACPYFLPIADRHILLFFSHMTGGQYLLGDYDTRRDKFVVTSHGRFNFGAFNPSGVHAPSAMHDGEGGVIAIFNMNAGKPTGEWNQLMTLPRRLTLSGRDEISQEPAGDIESLRTNHRQIGKMKLPANKEVILREVSGDAMEIILEADAKDVPAFEVRVLRSGKGEEYTKISFYRDRGLGGGRDYGFGEEPQPAPRLQPSAPRRPPVIRQSLITLETDYASLAPDAQPRAPEIAPVSISADETLKLRIFIDRSIVEVFVNGKQALAARVYPTRYDSKGVSLRAHGKDCQLIKLDAWTMKTIY